MAHTRMLVPLVVLLGMFSNVAVAQRAFGLNAAEEDLFLPAPRVMLRLLREAEQAIAEERFTDGIAALEQLLRLDSEDPQVDESLGQDYFLEPKRKGYYNRTIKGEAMRLLGTLPAEGRKSLEIRVGVKARQELDAAVASQTFSAIEAVARDYPHTEAGYDAMVLVAQLRMAEGQPLAAASLLQSLLEYPGARNRFGVKLAEATAIAFRQAGRKENAKEVLKRASGYFPNAEINAGRPVTLNEDTDWVAVVDGLTESLPWTSPMVAEEWMTSGGTAERNAAAVVGMPLASPRWFERNHGSIKEEEALAAVADSAQLQNKVILPKFEARCVNNLILSKTTDNAIFARNFHTGQLVWHYYFHRAAVDITDGYRDNFESTLPGAAVSEDLRNRVWGSSAFGNFSCDAERMYFVSTPDERQISLSQRRSSISGTNTLDGVSLARQGFAVWQVGGDKSDAEPKLTGAYFLGPPLPYQGQLFCIVEINETTFLVVLESATGREIWRQQLLQTRTIEQDTLRQGLAISPTISEGTILCPTGAGAIVAVDLQNRSLRWAKQYQTSRPAIETRGIGQMDFYDQHDALEPRWQEPFIIAQQGMMLTTPPESNVLLCLDILTGESKLRGDGERRGSGRYIVGANEQIIVVATNTKLVATQLDGRQGWELDFPKGHTLAGKGIWQVDSMLIPLSGRKLIKVDTQGKLLDTATVDLPLGNLFAYKQQLISVSATGVAVYFTRESLEKDVEARLALNPNDVWGLNRKSQLLIASGQLDAALAMLEKSYSVDPKNADTRFLLVEVLLAAFESNFAKYQPLAAKYDAVFDFPRQRFRYLQCVALGHVENHRYVEAFERLIELMKNRLNESFTNQQRAREMLKVGNGYSVESDAWIATQLARTYASAEPTDQRRMLALVERELESIRGSMLAVKRQYLRYLAWLPLAAPELLLAAEELKRVEPSISERLLQPVLLGPDAAAKATAERFLRNHPEEDWQQLIAFMGDLQPFPGRANLFLPPRNRTNSSERAQSEPQAMTLEGLQNLPPWPQGRMNQAEPTGGMFVGAVGSPLMGPQNRYGRPRLSIRATDTNIEVLNQNGDPVKVMRLDRATSDIDDPFRCHIDGGILLIESAAELVALDKNRESRRELLWRYSLLNPAAGPSRPVTHMPLSVDYSPLGFALYRRAGAERPSLVGPITPTGVVVQVGATINMLDLVKGSLVWSRDGFSDQTRFAVQGIEVAVVEPSTGVVLVLDCRDGSEIRKLPFKGDWKHWMVRGHLMVDYAMGQSKGTSSGLRTPADDPSTIRIWNPFNGEDVQRLELQPRSQATAIDEQHLAILEPINQQSSRLHFINLDNSRYVAHEVPRDADVDSIRGARISDRVVVFGYSARKSSTRKEKSLVQEDHIRASGLAFGLNADDGALAWPYPANLLDFVIPLSQPRHSPYFAGYRTAMVQGKASLAVMDVRDGSLAFAAENFEVQLPEVMDTFLRFRMTTDPIAHSLEISVSNAKFTLQATSDEQPPQPPYWSGQGMTNRTVRNP